MCVAGEAGAPTHEAAVVGGSWCTHQLANGQCSSNIIVLFAKLTYIYSVQTQKSLYIVCWLLQTFTLDNIFKIGVYKLIKDTIPLYS